MAKSWANLAELRARLKNFAEIAAKEEGLENAVVEVRVLEAKPGKPRVVQVTVQDRPSIDVEARPDVDGTDPVWEPIRGRKWEGN